MEGSNLFFRQWSVYFLDGCSVENPYNYSKQSLKCLQRLFNGPYKSLMGVESTQLFTENPFLHTRDLKNSQ